MYLSDILQMAKGDFFTKCLLTENELTFGKLFLLYFLGSGCRRGWACMVSSNQYSSCFIASFQFHMCENAYCGPPCIIPGTNELSSRNIGVPKGRWKTSS
jgi:hypothetical protein